MPVTTTEHAEKPKRKHKASAHDAPRIKSPVVQYLAIAALIIVAAYIFLALFQPGLKYKISSPPQGVLDSLGYLHELEALVDAKVSPHTKVIVLPNGENYYPAELAAIRAAKQNINLEAYIFKRGKIAQQYIEALTERAKAGVKVNVTLDAVGSISDSKHDFKSLRDAGGRVEWYHPLRWYNWDRYNNRTHRELLIVDGRVAFIGGAGVADHWLYKQGKEERWRDTMFRVEGDAVSSLQGTYIENWVQASQQLLTGSEYFPMEEGDGGTTEALVVNSDPSVGGSTRARILFQVLVASAQKRILITTPYFLPDRSLRQELVRAIKERGVQVTIITPGDHSDHELTRRSSERLFGDLLEAGAKIYEYKPAMIHAKIMIVDGLWSVVGSTNFDSRSFGLNDEVNLAGRDPELAAELEKQFDDDLKQSEQVTYDKWKSRSWFDRAQEMFGFLIQRQE